MTTPHPATVIYPGDLPRDHAAEVENARRIMQAEIATLVAERDSLLRRRDAVIRELDAALAAVERELKARGYEPSRD